MKNTALIFTFLLSTIVYGQKDVFYENSIIYAQYDGFTTEHYNAPKLNPLRKTSGLLIGFSNDLEPTPNFSLDFRFGYRFVSQYANPQAVTFFGSDSLSKDVYFDYHGVWTGFGFNFGRIVQWENALIIGLGRIKKPGFSGSNLEMELGLQSGFKYVSPYRIVLRAGVSANIARNGYFSSMASYYVGAGYAISRSEWKGYKRKENKGRPYVNIHLNGYIGSITLDLIGLNLSVDHLIYNGPVADIGYSVSGRIGLEIFDDPNYSASVAFLGLFGRNESKFELSAGPNFPFEEINTGFNSIYEAVHFGIGYRYISKEYPVSLRIGAATTGILQAGLGIKFPNAN